MNERRALDRIVPPGGWLGLIMDSGQTLRIVDLEGKQVVDLVALSADNPLEKLSCVYSVMLNRTWKLTTDHVLYSNLAQAMFTITEDTVGRHYSGGGFCTAEINRVRYGVEESANCADNFVEALRPYGIDRADFDFDTCFNINMNIVYAPDGSLDLSEPVSRPGDHIDLRAEMRLIVGISNCPQDRNPCNAFHPTATRVQVTG